MSNVQKALDHAKDQSTTKLGLTFNGKSVGGGEQVPRAEAQSPPTLTLSNANGVYIAIGLDLDAPFPSLAFLSPILHWIQPGLKADGNNGGQLSASGTPYVTDYIPPGPPPGSGPHRYLFLLYEQPASFDGKKFGQPEEGKQFGIVKRMRFNFDKFVQDAKLGEIVAANYFVSN